MDPTNGLLLMPQINQIITALQPDKLDIFLKYLVAPRSTEQLSVRTETDCIYNLPPHMTSEEFTKIVNYFQQFITLFIINFGNIISHLFNYVFNNSMVSMRHELQLEDQSSHDLKKQLRVQFIGEEGIDEGGVQKEFFQLCIKELFDPMYGMFKFNEESNLCWFTNDPAKDNTMFLEYKLIGRLIGVAIYNSVILDLHFPLALYKKLRGIKVDLEDIKELDPMLYVGLRKTLTDDDVESYEQTFQIQIDNCYGGTATVDLKPDGDNIKLTKENREETFGQLFISNTKYKLIYIFSEFDEEQKKRLLFFTTGTDRVPLGGTSKMQFIIARNGPDSDRLPSAHTCFSVLLLNDYATREKLKERLITALKNADCGFFLG
ncbi:hypothetical protein PIROE2DRAFT_61738 [Piromyces sp. E2]|nr:hypothetical protein PIROE2DRAFT_61738 [Piromyces sp. E2]|eukprot:OUM62668.1 hypothetical protein PIROE2DRAFT_61738 [Piromyces sp. E2]